MLVKFIPRISRVFLSMSGGEVDFLFHPTRFPGIIELGATFFSEGESQFDAKSYGNC